MKRNALLIGALAAAVAFTLLARNSANNGAGIGTGSAAGPTAPGRSGPSGTPTAPPAGPGGQPGAVDPDSFYTPTKLKPGQKPPQFIVVSFDGAGSHQKWQFWDGVAQQANMRFTAFLSGVYLVGAEHRAAYHGPGHRAGQSSINFFPTAEVRQEILD